MSGRLLSALWARMMFEKMSEKDLKEDGGPREGRHAKGMRGKDPKAPNVVFQLSADALEPRMAPWGYILRNPVGIILRPKESRRLNLHVALDTPALVWPVRPHTANVKFLGSGTGMAVIPPGADIEVIVTNDSEHNPLPIDDGESLVCLHPLFYDGTSVTG